MFFARTKNSSVGFKQVSYFCVVIVIWNEPEIHLTFSIEWLILDEADKLFEEGKNSFREQFDKIYKACTSGKVKVGLFSATWTMPVSKWGKKNLKSLYTISIGQRNSATDLVDQELVFVGNESGKMVAFRNLLKEGLKPPVLVFVDSKVSKFFSL